MKFAEEDIMLALKDAKLSKEDTDRVMEELEALANKLAEEKEKKTREKKKFVLINPNDTATFYLLQVKEDENPNDIVPNIKKSVGEYNGSAKKKKVELLTICDAIESIPAKMLKENGITRKGKEPCEVISVDNNL